MTDCYGWSLYHTVTDGVSAVIELNHARTRQIVMVRTCHAPRQSLENHPSGHSGGWATPWSDKEILNGQRHKEWTSLPMPELLTVASQEKRLAEDLC